MKGKVILNLNPQQKRGVREIPAEVTVNDVECVEVDQARRDTRDVLQNLSLFQITKKQIANRK